MKALNHTGAVPLPQACQRARRSRERMMRLIYEGQIEAHQDERGRWFVDAASLQRTIDEQSAGVTARAA